VLEASPSRRANPVLTFKEKWPRAEPEDPDILFVGIRI